MNPLGLKAQLWALGVCAAGLATLLILALYWRGEYREAKAALVAMTAQTQVLASSVAQCSKGAEDVKRMGDLAQSGMTAALARVEEFAAPKWRTVKTIETIIEKPAPPGAGCTEAWREIEAARQKAGASP